MVSLLRLLPWSPRVWLRMALAWWRYGPGFAFLGEVAAVRFPERLALLDEEGQLTFAQLWKESLELAGWLRQQGGAWSADRPELQESSQLFAGPAGHHAIGRGRDAAGLRTA